MARPEGLEPPALWFEVGFQRRQQTRANEKHPKNQREALFLFGWRRTVLYPVHGQYTDKGVAGSSEFVLDKRRVRGGH
jgi:hypothetical protein